VEELANWLKSQHKGLRTYKTFLRKVLDLGAKSRPQFALYYLLAMLVDRFVETYDERPLTLDIAAAAHNRLVAITDKAVRFNTMSAEEKLALLNEIAVSDLSPDAK
jgi:hypothetical protein